MEGFFGSTIPKCASQSASEGENTSTKFKAGFKITPAAKADEKPAQPIIPSNAR